jgi:undecaprenyl phosphate N,N'-diacetylbacillosamine 1-phosphate transferase
METTDLRIGRANGIAADQFHRVAIIDRDGSITPEKSVVLEPRSLHVTASFVERRKRLRLPLVYRHRRAVSFLQRIRDVSLATIAMIAMIPILAVAAFAIWCEDRGPILFKQQRVGRFERLFTIYKLRTMRVSQCGDGKSPTSSVDARITKIGRILRKTSIDELPQLFNIIRGDMTLVGPRPEMPFIVRRYARWQHLRHLETPGLTGLWQINHRSTIPLDKFEATAVDLDYIVRSSPMYDLSLIYRTFSALVRSKGAY